MPTVPRPPASEGTRWARGSPFDGTSSSYDFFEVLRSPRLAATIDAPLSVIGPRSRRHRSHTEKGPAGWRDRHRRGPGSGPDTAASCGRPGRGGSAEGVAAGAGAARIGVVDGEALLLDGVGEVDHRTREIGAAHLVDDDLDAVEVGHQVVVHGALVEVELVDQAGAAAGLHRDAQAQVIATLLLEQGVHLLGGAGGEGDAMRGGGALGGGRGHEVLLETRLRPGYAPTVPNGARRSRGAVPGLTAARSSAGTSQHAAEESDQQDPEVPEQDTDDGSRG